MLRGIGKRSNALALDAGERVEHVRLARVGDHVVEERAELRRGELAGGVGGELDDLLQLQAAGDRAADALQRLGALLLAQQPPAGLLGLHARLVLAREQLERLDRVGRHLCELDHDRLVLGRELAVLVPQLDQPEARAVAGDQRGGQARSGRRAVGVAPGDAVARPDHVAGGSGDDLEHGLVGGRRGHRPGGVGERSERVAHRAGS